MWKDEIKKARADLEIRAEDMRVEAKRLLEILKSYEEKALREGKDLNTRGKVSRGIPFSVTPENIMPADVFEATRLLHNVIGAIEDLRKRGNLSAIERRYGD